MADLRTTFAGIPDLPVSKFVIVLPGGKHGLLQASTNLCAKPVKGIIRLQGQNGKKVNRHVVIAQNHLQQRRDKLEAQIVSLTAERDGIDAAIKALDTE